MRLVMYDPLLRILLHLVRIGDGAPADWPAPRGEVPRFRHLTTTELAVKSSRIGPLAQSYSVTLAEAGAMTPTQADLHAHAVQLRRQKAMMKRMRRAQKTFELLAGAAGLSSDMAIDFHIQTIHLVQVSEYSNLNNLVEQCWIMPYQARMHRGHDVANEDEEAAHFLLESHGKSGWSEDQPEVLPWDDDHWKNGEPALDPCGGRRVNSVRGRAGVEAPDIRVSAIVVSKEDFNTAWMVRESWTHRLADTGSLEV